MAPACWFCGSVRERFRKGILPATSVSSYMAPVPFKLLHWYWSLEGVSLCKSVCGLFKRNCLGLLKFLPLTQSLLIFTARSYGQLSSWHWKPGVGLGLLTPKISLPIFIHHMPMWDQPTLHLCPSYQPGWMWFL